MTEVRLTPFSDRCLMDVCRTARRLSAETCLGLVAMEVRDCPGMATVDGTRVCSLGGEIAEVIGRDYYPGVPDSMIADGTRGVADGYLQPRDLPVATGDPVHNLKQWAALIRQLDAALYPGQQQL